MELTYQSTLLMPATYAVLSEEEMMYVDGGAITMEDVKSFAISFAHNAALLVGSISLSMGIEFLTASIGEAGTLAGGLSLVGAAIGGLDVWGKVALVGCTLCATYYVVYQTYQIYQLVNAAVGTFQQAYNDTLESMQQQTAAAAA